ncbi:MAG: LPS export ABC transporter periplasmic protein LptC [Deltaproteobacteria bacterium]|nr:LPS export ABC transporter periplasmic protein LptC [Deltaproteobacteria bacterium]
MRVLNATAMLFFSSLFCIAPACGGTHLSNERACKDLYGTEDSAGLYARGVVLTSYNKGKKVLTIHAARAAFSGGDTLFEKADAILFVTNSHGDYTVIRAKASRVKTSRHMQLVHMLGRVALEGKSLHIATRDLMLNRKTNRAFSNETALLSGKGFKAIGHGLEMDLEEERIVLLSGVKAVIELPESKR